VNPADLVNFLGALTGLGALFVAWWKLRRVDEARLGFEQRDTLIDQLQEEYRRLTEEVKRLSVKLEKTEDDLEETEHGRRVLQQRVSELIEENKQLHLHIGALQERTKRVPEAALEQMRNIAVRIAELNTYTGAHCPGEPVDDLAVELLVLVTGLPALIESQS
jgi:septal ring factor EnvC (AmiA/AmiB activator)